MSCEVVRVTIYWRAERVMTGSWVWAATTYCAVGPAGMTWRAVLALMSWRGETAMTF